MMKYASETGVYSLRRCFCAELCFFKDDASAIPYKDEYFRKFFDLFDDILLSEDSPSKIIGFQVHYPEKDRFVLDYGHWELLLAAMFFSLVGARMRSEELRQKVRQMFFCEEYPRFNWNSISGFWHDKIAGFKIDEFLKLPDNELDSVEKSIRPVAESAWEYINCIDISDDVKCVNVLNKIIDKAYFMVVAADDSDSSLQTAASMFGSYMKLTEIVIDELEEGWKIFEGEADGYFCV